MTRPQAATVARPHSVCGARVFRAGAHAHDTRRPLARVCRDAHTSGQGGSGGAGSTRADITLIAIAVSDGASRPQMASAQVAL